jgi:NACHT domain
MVAFAVGSHLQTLGKTTTPHVTLTTTEPRYGSPKARILPNGNRPVLFSGFMGNVCVSSPSLHTVAETDVLNIVAGSGKSVLSYVNLQVFPVRELIFPASSSIIQNLESMSKVGLASMAFFYCDFRDDEKQNLRGLLCSLLVQLCEQSDTYCSILSKLYSAHRDGSQSPSDKALTECLKVMLQRRGQAPIYIIVDGLDECPNTSGTPSSREKVLRLVKELVDQSLPNFHLCVTSRPEPDIETVLAPVAVRSMSLHVQEGQRRDIIDYIRSVVNTDPKTQRWRPQDKELVFDVLSRRADGM